MSAENSEAPIAGEPLFRERTQGRTGTPAALFGRDWLPPALAVLAAAAVYSVTLSFEFVYDDNQQIIFNPQVQSWRHLPTYFFKDVWSQWGGFAHSVYYRPVFLAWLLLNFKLFGLDPVWWHLTTLSVHLVATWLVYALTRRVTGDPYTPFIAALLFGLHPAHVETVAWVSGVTDSLLAVFLLSSSLYYLRGRAAGNLGVGNQPHLALSLALYALALLSKETAAVFPAIIFVYAWAGGAPAPGRLAGSGPKEYSRRVRAAFAQAFPYFGLLLLYLALRAVVLKGLLGTVTPLSLRTELGTAPSLTLRYLKHLVWPFNLSVFYNTPYVDAPGLSADFLLPLAVIGLLAAGLLWWARRSRVVTVAAAWLVLPFLPVLKISAFGSGDIFHDRYLYLPSVGFSILVAVGLRQIGPAVSKGNDYAPALAALVLACLYGYGALRESRHWASDLRLYARALEVAPDNVDAVSKLAAELAELGRCEEAIPLYMKALEQRPDAWKTYHGLSICHYQAGRYGQAGVFARQAIQLSPENPVLRLRLGIILLAMGRLDEAEDEVRQAVTLQTGGKGIDLRFQGGGTGSVFIYHFTLGEVLRRKGDLRGALAEFRAGLADQPDESNAEKARQLIRRVEAELSKAENK